ncbi:hypothetical protein V8C34DRAFT_268934 [Trichoderma compactum]
MYSLPAPTLLDAHAGKYRYLHLFIWCWYMRPGGARQCPVNFLTALVPQLSLRFLFSLYVCMLYTVSSPSTWAHGSCQKRDTRHFPLHALPFSCWAIDCCHGGPRSNPRRGSTLCFSVQGDLLSLDVTAGSRWSNPDPSTSKLQRGFWRGR